MVKFCFNCGKELKENADICLNCGVAINNGSNTIINSSNNKKKGMPGWGIALIILACLVPFIIFGMLIALSFFAVDDSVDLVREKNNDFGERYIKRYKNKYDVVNEGSIGDSLNYKGLRFTLNKVNRYDSIGTNVTEDYDEEYVVFFFDIENTSDELKSISLMNFNVIGEYDEETPEVINDMIDDVSKIDIWESINAYEKISGYVAFKIDKDMIDFNIIYSDILDDSAIIFNVTNNIVRKV